MAEDSYKNREIDEKFDDILGFLGRIEGQTTKTNGAVADLNKWRERVNGGAIVAGVFMTVAILPILSWALYILLNINSIINQSVAQALSAYQIEP